jgi:autotransporter-associated beta strand protein
VLTTNVTTELTDNNGTQDPSLGGDISWVAGATIDSQAGQSHRLTLRSGTGATTFNANIGGTTALASLVVANTTGRVTFGGADLAAGDLAPVTLVRTYGDIDVGRGALDADEVIGGIVLNAGSQPDATLTFRTLAEGNVRFNGPVTLASDVVITTNGDGDTGTGRNQAGDVTFTDSAAVDSLTGEHNNLVLRAGTGTVRFGANVGQTVALQSLTVEDTTGGVIFGTSDAVGVDSETGPVALVRIEGDLVLGAGPSDPGVSGQIVFNGGAPAEELLVHATHGAIRIRGNVTLGSTTTFRHTGEASLSIGGGTLNILDPDSQLVIDAVTDPQADAPTDANPTGIIESRITGAGRLVKTGAGWLRLTYQGDNTYGGGTTIAGGTLSISKDGHLGSAPDTPVPDSILIDGATLYVRSDVPMDQLPYTFWLDGHRGITLGPGSVAGWGEIFVQRDVMMMVGGVVADNEAAAGSLRKTGPGILMLNGLNTYTGTTYILAGTLLINGSTSPASTVYVGGQRADDGVWIGGEPIRVTEQYAMLGGVGVVHGNVVVLGMPEVGADWVAEPPGGHVNPGSILDQPEWIKTTKPDGTVVRTWGLPTVPGILTVGPIEFLPNSYLNIDFGNGGVVDPVTGWGKAPGFPYPGGSAAWEEAFADWQSQPGPERGLPPVDRTGYDQLRVMGDLTINAAILQPNLQYVPLAWEAQFLIADFDGDGRVIGSLFQDRTYTIDGEDYVLRYDRGPNNRSIAFEAAGFTPMFRALPTPEAPVLVVARDLGPVAPATLRPYQEPPPPPMANLAAGGEVVGGSERFVEVRVVTPIDDAGNVEEITVLKLPVSVLRDLRRLVAALPDDRYRVYLVVEHGQGRTSEEFLVREMYVREGRPVDRDERLPRTAPPAEDDPSGKPQEEPDDGQTQGPAEDGGSAAAASAGAIAGGAALWQARIDQAIAKYAKRVPSKAIRLCRGKRNAMQTSSHGKRGECQWEKGASE